MATLSNREAQLEQEQVFQAVRRALAGAPGLVQELAKSPAAGRVYVEGQRIMAGASLSPRERLAVALAASAHGRCAGCLAAGRAAAAAAGIPAEELAAIEEGRAPRDPSLAPFVVATHLVLETGGRVSANHLARLEDAGVDRRRLYEIVALVGLESIASCMGHIAHVEGAAALQGASGTGQEVRR